jgi:proteasome maturation protein
LVYHFVHPHTHKKCKTLQALIGKGGGATVQLKYYRFWFVVLFSHRYSSARDEISPAHPLEQVLTSHAVREEALRMQILRDAQGSGVPLRMQMERSIVSRVQRLPPLQSSMIALETLTGMNTRLAPEDIFNPPSEALVTVDTHSAMQRKLNMN